MDSDGESASAWCLVPLTGTIRCMGDAARLAEAPTPRVRYLLVWLVAQVVAGLVAMAWIGWSGSAVAWWATTLQCVGALVTFGGLWWAYVRAKTGLGLWELVDHAWLWVVRRWDRLRGRDVSTVVHVAGIEVAVAPGTPDVYVEFAQLQRQWPVEDQLGQLAEAVVRLQDRLREARKELAQLAMAIEDLRQLSEFQAREAVTAVESKIEQFNAGLARGQQLDLKWAIAGLLISAAGTFVQYWT